MSSKTSFLVSKFEVKKSKFLAFSFFVSSETEVKQYIAKIKTEHSDARHFV